MIPIHGLHNAAICFCADLEPAAREQIQTLCDQPAFAGCQIRIMPDVHAGKGCTIGTTMTLRDKVVPAMVGVDIGCGMHTVRIAESTLDFAALDACIRAQIPSGQEVRERPHRYCEEIDLSALRCADQVNLDRARRSVGTLGGGNHFIEVDRGQDGALYLVVHSGSRHIGNEVAQYYQRQGYLALGGSAQYQINEAIAELKAQGRHREIASTIQALKKQRSPVPEELAYVQGTLFQDYIHDMKIIQLFATLNRQAMASVILAGLGLTAVEEFTTIHNYIDTDTMILRKGAVSAQAGEKLLIPINMRDGSLLCVGRGNPDWNYSAPHGAGRLMSRHKARATLSLEQYRAQMDGIYSTCLSAATLDESPMAYKPIEDILAQIDPTAQVMDRIRPVYNFKAE